MYSESAIIWNEGLCQCNSYKMSLLGWVLVQYRHTQREDNRMIVEAEIGATRFQAKELQGLPSNPGSCEAQEDSFLGISWGEGPDDTSVWDFQPSELV